MQYLLSGHDKIIRAVVQLPSSKSISNRVLIMNAISFSPYGIGNLSDSDDTRVMKQVIDSNSSKFNIGHAGTAMRFLTAFLSRIVGEWMLTGSERMKQRPIGILVDALRELGADIRSAGKVGYPPIVIRGSHLKGKLLELDAASAASIFPPWLMIGPTLEGGLPLNLKKQDHLPLLYRTDTCPDEGIRHPLRVERRSDPHRRTNLPAPPLYGRIGLVGRFLLVPAPCTGRRRRG